MTSCQVDIDIADMDVVGNMAWEGGVVSRQ